MIILCLFISINCLVGVKSYESDSFFLHMEAPYKTISKYTLYRDVSIINFVVPVTKTAKFSFKALEFQKCDPQPITVYIKAGSFPVISPQNISFPGDYLDDELR